MSSYPSHTSAVAGEREREREKREREREREEEREEERERTVYVCARLHTGLRAEEPFAFTG